MKEEKKSDCDPTIVVLSKALHEVGFEIRSFKTGFDAIGAMNKSSGEETSLLYTIEVVSQK
jgi:hypothetical protein